MEEALDRSSSLSLEAATSYEFDVFLSFRGPDARKKFTSHLYHGLKNVGFRVYLDEKEMNKGEQINEDLKSAIIKSRICMPIFSENYASSKPCLLELSHMVDCNKKIIPIFYNVTPDVVKLKEPSYKKYLDNYRTDPRFGINEVEKWEKALLMVAENSGYDLHGKNEAEEITKIIDALLVELMPKKLDVSRNLVETIYEVKCVEDMLNLTSNDFRIVGIFGMGGIGKTTLAKVIFNRVGPGFPRCCSFLEDVLENVQSNQHVRLQRQLYKDIISSSYAESIHDRNDGIIKIKNGLEVEDKKFLLVLDDVSDVKDLTSSIGHEVHFTSGSRLIITTRDKKVLDELNKYYEIVLTYHMKEMDDDRALKLFSRHAFGKDSPPEKFQNLSKDAISYTKGLPLALEVVGSSLYCNKDAWEETLQKLKKSLDENIASKLMISYEGLDRWEQEIFLDIASYYGNMDKEYACYMWEDSNLYPKLAIENLLERSLIKIIGNMSRECFWMHDMLKELERAVIQDKAGKSVPGRLRIDGSLDILQKTKEKAHVEMLSINAPDIAITSNDMIGLDNLRFLELKVQNVLGDFDELLPNLKWFRCSNARDFEAIHFNPKGLLVLDISNANIPQHLRSIKVDALKVLNFSCCFFIPKMHESVEKHGWVWIFRHLLFGQSTSNGQVLDFKCIENATSLEKLTLQIQLPSLDRIFMTRPSYLSGLDKLGKLSRLGHLHLSCARFSCVPVLPYSLLRLQLNQCSFPDGTLDVSTLKNLTYLEISNPEYLGKIEGLGDLYSLEELFLCGLNSIWNLGALFHSKCLGVLTSGSSNLGGFPQFHERLKQLRIFSLISFHILRDLQGMPLEELLIPTGLSNLESLSLWHCQNMVRIVRFDGLECLTSLTITGCPSFKGLPKLSILRMLKRLTLCACNKLRWIGGIPRLESLEYVDFLLCNSLRLNPPALSKLENVRSVIIQDCNNLPYIYRP